MSKSRTRLTVATSSCVYELFSIIEKRNGELTVLPKPSCGRIVLEGFPDAIDFNQEYFSVHLSNKSDGVSISHTITDTSGFQVQHSSFIPRKSGFCYPLYARRFAWFPTKISDFTASNVDRLVQIGSFNPWRQTLVYVVQVASKELSECDLVRDNVSIKIIPFKVYNVVVHAAKSFMPSLPRGGTAYATTSGYTKVGDNKIGLEFHMIYGVHPPHLLTASGYICLLNCLRDIPILFEEFIGREIHELELDRFLDLYPIDI